MSDSDAGQPFDQTSQELVLLIHGTFANNESAKRDEDNPGWWEEGGDVWKKIDEQLPNQFHVARDRKTEVFSWSGDNSERARRASGQTLFKHLQKLEKAGTRYHLVGHSHGGSVIWHCLQESVRRRLRRRRSSIDEKLALPGLRSCTTIGTPFLQLRSVGMVSRVSPWLWLAVLAAATIAMYQLISMIDGGVEVPKQSEDSSPFTVATAMLLDAIMEHPVAAGALGLFAALAAFFAMVMWAWSAAIQLEASVVREEARIRNQAFVEFGARWLGIWSRHDEAINGLRASLQLTGQIAPRIEVSGVTVFDFDRRMRTYRILARWFMAPIFNLFVARPSDGIIWRSVSRGMQGNDRPGCHVSDISPGPIVPRQIEWEQLPESYDGRLVKQSNDHLIARSKTLIPQLREVLSQMAWTKPEQLSLLMSNETTFEGNELVHTSYFHEPAILEMIACHIVRHNKVKAPQSDPKSATSRWCRRFRHKARDLSNEPSLQLAALPLLRQRNLRAILALMMALVLLTAPFWSKFVRLPGDDSILEWLADYGWLVAIAATCLAWSSIRRAKCGACCPRFARWAWRFCRLALVAYVIAVFSDEFIAVMDFLFA